MRKIFFIVSILLVTSVVYSQQKQVQTSIDATKNKIGAEFNAEIFLDKFSLQFFLPFTHCLAFSLFKEAR